MINIDGNHFSLISKLKVMAFSTTMWFVWNLFPSTSIMRTCLWPSVFFSIFRLPVSCFSEDSVYAVSPPQVVRDSRDEFESHVMTGQGQVRALCRDDILMYREYVKNRYMWDANRNRLSVGNMHNKIMASNSAQNSWKWLEMTFVSS